MLRLLALVFALCLPAVAEAGDSSTPWEKAKVLEKTYSKQKVVYDVSVKTVAQLETCWIGRVTFPC